MVPVADELHCVPKEHTYLQYSAQVIDTRLAPVGRKKFLKGLLAIKTTTKVNA